MERKKSCLGTGITLPSSIQRVRLIVPGGDVMRATARVAGNKEPGENPEG